MPDRARDIVWGRVKEESTANIDGLDGRTYCAPAFGDLVMMVAVWIYSVRVQDTAYIGMSCGSINLLMNEICSSSQMGFPT